MTDPCKVLQFCKIVGTLKHLKRTGWVQHDIPEPETVACHMYRMAMLSMLLSDDVTLTSGEKLKLDKTKCMKMSLVHDLGEAIVGDITPHCGMPEDVKFKEEEAAIIEISSHVSNDVGDEIKSLWYEYEDRKTAEALAVKDLDKFDMIMQAFEYEQSTKQPKSLQQFFDRTSFSQVDVVKWVDALNKERDSQ